MYKLHYDYIKNKYDNNSRPLFTDTNSLRYEIKTEDIYDDFSSDTEIFDFSNYSTKSKYYDGWNKLVIGKMKDGIAALVVKEFVGFMPKMYLILVNDNSEHKKVRGVNRNVVEKLTHNEYKDACLNKKYIRHSMNRIQNKDLRIRTYEINKILLPCFDYKIYFQNNG